MSFQEPLPVFGQKLSSADSYWEVDALTHHNLDLIQGVYKTQLKTHHCLLFGKQSDDYETRNSIEVSVDNVTAEFSSSNADTAMIDRKTTKNPSLLTKDSRVESTQIPLPYSQGEDLNLKAIEAVNNFHPSFNRIPKEKANLLSSDLRFNWINYHVSSQSIGIWIDSLKICLILKQRGTVLQSLKNYFRVRVYFNDTLKLVHLLGLPIEESLYLVERGSLIVFSSTDGNFLTIRKFYSFLSFSSNSLFERNESHRITCAPLSTPENVIDMQELKKDGILDVKMAESEILKSLRKNRMEKLVKSDKSFPLLCCNISLYTIYTSLRRSGISLARPDCDLNLSFYLLVDHQSVLAQMISTLSPKLMNAIDNKKLNIEEIEMEALPTNDNKKRSHQEVSDGSQAFETYSSIARTWDIHSQIQKTDRKNKMGESRNPDSWSPSEQFQSSMENSDVVPLISLEKNSRVVDLLKKDINIKRINLFCLRGESKPSSLLKIQLVDSSLMQNI